MDVKWCTGCKTDQPRTELYKNRAKPDGLQDRCKSCVKVRDQERSRDEAAIIRRRRQSLINDLGGACACCGEDTYEFLQIDHVNNNGGEYRKSLRGKQNACLSISQLRKHIEELQVLCANCHNAKSYHGRCPHHH